MSHREKRKVFIHIGSPKTGTTSFQKALWNTRDSLASDHDTWVVSGKIFPGRGISQCIEIALFVLRSGLDSSPRRTLQEFGNAEISREELQRTLLGELGLNYGKFIISNEDLFFARTKQEASCLLSLLEGFDVAIVLVLRDRNAFARSYNHQVQKQGSQSEDRESVNYTQSDSWIYNYGDCMDTYAYIFGADKVRTIFYDAEVAANRSILPAIWEACELPASLVNNISAIWENAAESGINQVINRNPHGAGTSRSSLLSDIRHRITNLIENI